MRCKTLVALQVILLSTSQMSAARAQPTSRTVLSFYEVTGNSLSELHRDMLRKGPNAGGGVGYGMTTVRPGNKMSIAACKSKGHYSFDAEFVIVLPSIAASAGLTAAERRQFSSFVNFVRKHEEIHRSIWMRSITQADSELRASRTTDCAAAHSKAMRLWQDMMAGCRRLHIAFDKQQRSPLRSHPFVRSAKR